MGSYLRCRPQAAVGDNELDHAAGAESRRRRWLLFQYSAARFGACDIRTPDHEAAEPATGIVQAEADDARHE
jgi:hypothetical protein